MTLFHLFKGTYPLDVTLYVGEDRDKVQGISACTYVAMVLCALATRFSTKFSRSVPASS